MDVTDPAQTNLMSDPAVIAAWIVVIAGFLTTAIVVLWQRSIAKKNATLDVLFRFRENPEHIQITADFLGLWENKSSVLHMSTLDMLLAIKDPEDFSSWPSGMVEERQKIDRFLNRYKMISIGINVHALHEHLFKRCWRSIFVRHYIRSLRYIYYQQRINPVIFIAYSVLAEKWMTSQESEECRFLKQDLEKEISVYENKHGINFRDRYR